MIPRYSLPEMAELFSDEARFATWLDIEILAVEAWARLGVIPAGDAKEIRERAPVIDRAIVDRIGDREKVTDHDVAAFVDVMQDIVGGEAAKWIHYGLTSSDVVDTAWCAMLARAGDLLIGASQRLVETLRRRALEFRDTPMVGRTHGVHAEPTTFGVKLALWTLQAERDHQRLRAARQAIAVGKLSGAVGTYSNIEPEVEAEVCEALGLQPTPATQVIARDRHAEYLWACASVGSTVEMMATEIRHLARTEVREVQEAFRSGQKGSSSMPHKRNPIKSEQLSGLSRVLRGYLAAGLQDVALWHERDISHSSVERVILPDASLLAYYVLEKMRTLIDGLQVFGDRMAANLDASYGLVFSQPVLLALVAAGLPRDRAYRVVQRNAMEAWEQGRSFRELLDADPDVDVDPSVLDNAFDLARSLRNRGRVFEAIEQIPYERSD